MIVVTILPASGERVSSRGVIAALGSGQGPGAIGIIRVSGDDALARLSLILIPKGEGVWDDRKMRLCKLVDPHDGSLIDEPLAVVFRAPHSYTGEESVEIFCHGGSFLLRKALGAIYECGIRPAEPGEFTQRAYLNGKLDLVSAEGIRELIEAQSQYQLQAAHHLMNGRLQTYVTDLRKALVAAMGYLEALIDFPDEGDVATAHRSAAVDLTKPVLFALKRLRETYDDGRVMAQGLRVALIGPPNAGKSTLLNTLLGEDRAIVTDLPGTTRDYLEERCLLQGRLVRLVDTAGIRDTVDPVEKAGVQRSQRIAAEADVTVLLVSCETPAKERDQIAEKMLAASRSHVLKVITKIDLNPDYQVDSGWIPMSCVGNNGSLSLINELVNLVDKSAEIRASDIPFLTAVRHANAVEKAIGALKAFFLAEEQGAYEECLAFELQIAARALNGLVGRIDAEDVLEHVFRTFCIGK